MHEAEALYTNIYVSAPVYVSLILHRFFEILDNVNQAHTHVFMFRIVWSVELCAVCGRLTSWKNRDVTSTILSA